MKYYIEITLLPDADITLYFLWEKVYQQLHLAFVNIQNTDKRINIGVSFPEYDNQRFQLGKKLRLMACSKQDLLNLKVHQALSRLSDYVHITSVRHIPNKIVAYAYFKRIQLKNNNKRLAKRKAMRHKIPLNEAVNYFNSRKEVYSQAPFIRIKSLSSDQKFRLLIDKIEVNQPSKTVFFSTYGLSSSSSVPIF